VGGSSDEASDLAKGIWQVLFNGYASDTGNAFLDKLLSKGGMSSMLNTVWLIICALSFGGILEKTGILDQLIGLALRGVRGVTSLVAATVATCFATNVLAADQFIAIALPGRMFKQAYRDQGLDEINLSRTLEDSGTLTSALIPWNTCGAYMSATLGVATLSYAPYAFFNLLCPLLAIAFAARNLGQKHLPRA
jgi:NhaC family Na+:H+ antiporter